MVRKYTEQQEDCVARYIRHWEEDYTLLDVLSGLPTGRKEVEDVPLYTPALAWRAGIADRIFILIQGRQDAFSDQNMIWQKTPVQAPGSS